MIYYIFGDDTPVCLGTINTALYECYELNEAIEKFKAINLNHKFPHTYLVCDFEIYKNKMFQFAFIEDGAETIPFLVLGEYHEEEDSDPTATFRQDTIIVESKGFRHEFKDNCAAVRQFETNISNHKDTKIYIRYKYINDCNQECFNTSMIVDSEDIFNKIDKNYKIKKFSIRPLEWEQYPLRRNEINLNMSL